MTNKKFSKQISTLWTVTLLVMFATILTIIMVASANALDATTNPTILSVSPTNNMQDLSRNPLITVSFNEDMDPSTINNDTIIVTQRTTPESGVYRSIAIDGIVIYNEGRTATFTPNILLSPGEQYGNVFTVNITTGVKDLAGNALSQDYIWSFTTGSDVFNTGISTSQQNQSNSSAIVPIVAPIPFESPLTPVPITVAPIVTPIVTPSNQFWIWGILGGAILLLLVIFISTRLVNRIAQKTPQKNTRASRPNPFGDVHPVIAIEGIGPEYNKKLNAMGIKNTKQLWGADAVTVARKTGAALSSVKSWQNMAELSSVKDIGPQYAELIERSGIHDITQLRNTNTNELLRLVREKQESLKINIQGNSPGHATVEHWIAEAREHQYTDPLEGQTA